jgi:hypothetical protein
VLSKWILFATYRLLAWLYNRKLCARIGLVYGALSRQAWKSGYYTACGDLLHKRVSELSPAERLLLKDCSRCPALFSYRADFLDIWGDGYERAIMLWRLGKSPSHMWKNRHPLARSLSIPEFESMIRTIIRGDLRAKPSFPTTIDGAILAERLAYENALQRNYDRYAERRQQIYAAHHPLVAAEAAADPTIPIPMSFSTPPPPTSLHIPITIQDAL